MRLLAMAREIVYIMTTTNKPALSPASVFDTSGSSYPDDDLMWLDDHGKTIAAHKDGTAY